jgi:hypothetical protein
MDLKNVTLSNTGGVRGVDIAFGFAQHGQYRIFIWDSNGANPVLIGQGVNTDDVPDQFPINEPIAQLNNRIVSWEGLVTSFDGGPGEHYSVRVRFTQDGAVVPDSPFVQSGDLDDVKAFYDAVRLVVA